VGARRVPPHALQGAHIAPPALLPTLPPSCVARSTHALALAHSLPRRPPSHTHRPWSTRPAPRKGLWPGTLFPTNASRGEISKVAPGRRTARRFRQRPGSSAGSHTLRGSTPGLRRVTRTWPRYGKAAPPCAQRCYPAAVTRPACDSRVTLHDRLPRGPPALPCIPPARQHSCACSRARLARRPTELPCDGALRGRPIAPGPLRSSQPSYPVAVSPDAKPPEAPLLFS
jgi:hypothetical protein